jgi:hypothetical protein
MASTYPTTKDNFATNHQDGVSEIIHASIVNDNADAVNKIENELGVLPKGVYADVAARLNTLETLVLSSVSAATYTFVLADVSTCVGFTNTTSTTVTVPSNTSVAIPIGGQIMVRQGHTAGPISFIGDTGVTLFSRGSLFNTAGPAAWVTLVKIGTSTWDLFGDLA